MQLAALDALCVCINPMRSRSGRTWQAIHSDETVAEALGIYIARTEQFAFVLSLSMTAMTGALFAHDRGVVSVDAVSLDVTILDVAMIIIGGIGSFLGAPLGADFATLFPYLIEGMMEVLPAPTGWQAPSAPSMPPPSGRGMVLFLVVEPRGSAGVWRRIRVWSCSGRFATVPLGLRNTLLTVETLEVVCRRAITAIQDASLNVAGGKITSLLGTNGAGTTSVSNASAASTGRAPGSSASLGRICSASARTGSRGAG